MSWYYNTESGALTSSGAVQSLFQDIQAAVGAGAGWHKLNIPATDNGTQAAAAARKEFPAGTAPTTSVKTQASNEGSQVLTGSATGLSGLNAIGSFFSALTEGATWIRVAEGLLGIILIAVGVSHMTHIVPITKAIAAHPITKTIASKVH